MILCSCSSPRSTSRVSETLICFSGAALAFALHPLAEQSPFQGQLRFPRTEHIDNNVLAKDLGLKFRTSASENPAAFKLTALYSRELVLEPVISGVISV